MSKKLLLTLTWILIAISFIISGCQLSHTQSPESLPKKSEYKVHVHLFRGEWDGKKLDLKNDLFISENTHYTMAALKANTEITSEEEAEAVIDLIIDLTDVKSVVDMFTWDLPWERKLVESSFVLEGGNKYKIENKLERISKNQVEIQSSLIRTRDKVPIDKRRLAKKDLETIFRKEFTIKIEDPVIIGVPFENEAYFLLLELRRAQRAIPNVEADGIGSTETHIQKEPKLIEKVYPLYPEELYEQGVKGAVGVRLIIDKKGSVQFVQIKKPLHPYLDNAVVQALRQWKFEPGFLEEEKITFFIDLNIYFNEETLLLQKGQANKKEALTETSSKRKLQKILNKSGEYCQKLEKSVLEFVCLEDVRKINYNIFKGKNAVQKRKTWRSGTYNGLPTYISVSFTDWTAFSGRTEITRYLCDYMFARKDEGIKQQQILLKKDGREMPEPKPFLNEGKITALNPIFSTTRILAPEHQAAFFFHLLGEDKIKGRKTYVIEAMPKSGNEAGVIYAKVWVDKKHFQIIKSEIKGPPIKGYENILWEAGWKNMSVVFTRTYHYEKERNKILFPSQASVLIKYEDTGYMGRDVTRFKMDIKYTDYKFFTVTTDEDIKKELAESRKLLTKEIMEKINFIKK